MMKKFASSSGGGRGGVGESGGGRNRSSFPTTGVRLGGGLLKRFGKYATALDEKLQSAQPARAFYTAGGGGGGGVTTGVAAVGGVTNPRVQSTDAVDRPPLPASPALQLLLRDVRLAVQSCVETAASGGESASPVSVLHEASVPAALLCNSLERCLFHELDELVPIAAASASLADPATDGDDRRQNPSFWPLLELIVQRQRRQRPDQAGASTDAELAFAVESVLESPHVLTPRGRCCAWIRQILNQDTERLPQHLSALLASAAALQTCYTENALLRDARASRTLVSLLNPLRPSARTQNKVGGGSVVVFDLRVDNPLFDVLQGAVGGNNGPFDSNGGGIAGLVTTSTSHHRRQTSRGAAKSLDLVSAVEVAGAGCGHVCGVYKADGAVFRNAEGLEIFRVMLPARVVGLSGAEEDNAPAERSIPLWRWYLGSARDKTVFYYCHSGSMSPPLYGWQTLPDGEQPPPTFRFTEVAALAVTASPTNSERDVDPSSAVDEGKRKHRASVDAYAPAVRGAPAKSGDDGSSRSCGKGAPSASRVVGNGPNRRRRNRHVVQIGSSTAVAALTGPKSSPKSPAAKSREKRRNGKRRPRSALCSSPGAHHTIGRDSEGGGKAAIPTAADLAISPALFKPWTLCQSPNSALPVQERQAAAARKDQLLKDHFRSIGEFRETQSAIRDTTVDLYHELKAGLRRRAAKQVVTNVTATAVSSVLQHAVSEDTEEEDTLLARWKKRTELLDGSSAADRSAGSGARADSDGRSSSLSAETPLIAVAVAATAIGGVDVVNAQDADEDPPKRAESSLPSQLPPPPPPLPSSRETRAGVDGDGGPPEVEDAHMVVKNLDTGETFRVGESSEDRTLAALPPHAAGNASEQRRARARTNSGSHGSDGGDKHRAPIHWADDLQVGIIGAEVAAPAVEGQQHQMEYVIRLTRTLGGSRERRGRGETRSCEDLTTQHVRTVRRCFTSFCALHADLQCSMTSSGPETKRGGTGSGNMKRWDLPVFPDAFFVGEFESKFIHKHLDKFSASNKYRDALPGLLSQLEVYLQALLEMSRELAGGEEEEEDGKLAGDSSLQRFMEDDGAISALEMVLMLDNRAGGELASLSDDDQLAVQRFVCAGCGGAISSSLFGLDRNFRHCRYMDKLFCRQHCHKEERRVLPHRIVHQWDFGSHRVSTVAASYIDSIAHVPAICLSALHPDMFQSFQVLRHVRSLRVQLSYIKDIVARCENGCVNLAAWLGDRSHLADDTELYSPNDLGAVEDGTLATFLGGIVERMAKHVTTDCDMCREQGVFCELCNSPTPIYSFQIWNVMQCGNCKGTYHKRCFREMGSERSCPRCERIDQAGI